AGLVGLVVLGVVLTVVALFYYLSVARSTFMAEGDSGERVRTGLPLRVAIIVCLVAVVALGLWPNPLVGEAAAATRAFLGAQRHSHGGRGSSAFGHRHRERGPPLQRRGDLPGATARREGHRAAPARERGAVQHRSGAHRVLGSELRRTPRGLARHHRRRARS